MKRVIGAASEFYRLRLMRIDAGGEVEFEWRDDVLWRKEPSTFAEESDVWRLEAVTLDADETATTIALFSAHDDAHAALEEAAGDLDEMTKSEFESEYLHAPAEDSAD